MVDCLQEIDWLLRGLEMTGAVSCALVECSHSHSFFESQFATEVCEAVRLKCGVGSKALNLVSGIFLGIQNCEVLPSNILCTL